MDAQKTSKKHGVTREALLNAGLKLFSEHGFDGTAIKDIELAVGLTPGSGSFYRHFKTKQHLLEEVVHREVEKIRQMRDLQQRAVKGSLGDRRAEWVMEFRLSLMGLGEIKELINLLGREYGRFPELMQQLRSLLVDESLELAALDLQGENPLQEKMQGGVSGQDTAATASVMMSALVGYHLASTYFGEPPGNIDAERFVNALADLLVQT